MRVLLLCRELPSGEGGGGIATYTRTLAPALAGHGVEVHVLSVAPGSTPSTETTSEGVHEHHRPLVRPRGPGRLTGLPQCWDRISGAWAVARAARQLGRFDVVESPEWLSEGLFVRRFLDAPIVVRLHGSAGQIYPFLGQDGRDERLAAQIEDSFVRRANAVIGSDVQIVRARDTLGIGSARTFRIPCPVPDPNRARPVVTAPSDPMKVCFVGRFEERKGPQTLVRALPLIRQATPGVRLALFGRDTADARQTSFAASLRDLARSLGVLDALEIHDRWLTPSEVEHVLTSSAVCAVPSLWESFGLVAAQASALGRPVVAADAGGLPEVVAHGMTGLLAPPHEPAAWAGAISSLLLNPSLARRLGANGRRRIKNRFAPGIVASSTIDAYEAARASWQVENPWQTVEGRVA